MKTKTKLPPGWEKCKTGIKGVCKWRNMATQCGVTDHAADHAEILSSPNVPGQT